ncbi:T9SS type A sorting domain-containing protein [Hymenobacter psychrotolerans]|uniref:Por secretion system C-terminal sorting domain-containing protein n=1 Tax=Hymenobacter psychrotolerans DSM 18569 TaxID=1121959 RepID=A0A1M7GGP6_9BACT|nr:T9SS type A sorting domain-containing protein [Hymenobacter psychrotolerans]SHM15440.1 Por secretion system C-terminal sorting domain-containing protein [Hymenobacter psychrotolerans DSM 18569]
MNDVRNDRSGFLIHDSNNPNLVSKGFLKPSTWADGGTFSPDHRLYVRLNPGETLNYGVHRIYNGQGVSTAARQQNLILTLRYGANAGTIVKQTKLYRDSTNSTANNNLNRSPLLTTLGVLGLPQAGVIVDAQQNQRGPQSLLNPLGYVPLTYTNNTGQARDFYIEFTQQNEVNLGDNAKWSYYDFWDFTVKDAGGNEKKGRLFSKYWAFSSYASTGSAGAFQNRLSANFKMYTLIESAQTPGRYYIKQLELAGMRPLDFFFVANEFGATSGTNRTTIAQRRRSQTSDLSYPQYFNFVNDPDADIWPSAPTPTFARTYQAFCNSILSRGSAAFTTVSSETGSVNILVDLNNNGVKDGNDVLIEQVVTTAGVPVTSSWNGLNAAGATVATGATVRLSFTSTGAAVNFPIFDAEGNPDGFRVQNIRPSSGGDAYYDRLYWDDTNLTANSAANFPAAPAAPDNSNQRLDGVISDNGVHRWGDATNQAGNAYMVNTWTYGFISAASEQVYSYNYNCDFDGDGVDDALDVDDDNDGIKDVDESYGANPQTYTLNGVVKTDGTGVPIYLDGGYVTPQGRGAWRDVNADGMNDYFDIDLDGIPNHLDTDSDGDGLPDAIEANNGKPVANYDPNTGSITGAVSSAAGARGMPQNAQTSNNSGVSIFANPDQDGDGVLNIMDRDSDNDGIPDLVEIQSSVTVPAGRAATGNGLAFRAPLGADDDNDGIDNRFDPDFSGSTALLYAWNSGTNQNNTPGTAPTLVDYLDLDSDNDGLPDGIENNNGGLYLSMNNNGRIPALDLQDANRDGLDDRISLTLNTTVGLLADRDGDAVPNYRDLDTDNDGIPDMIEANNGAILPGATYAGQYTASAAVANDNDGDGLVNIVDPDELVTILILNSDKDGDGLRNYMDKDSDNDGIPDMREANLGALIDGNSDSEGQTVPVALAGNDQDSDGHYDAVDPNSAAGAAFATPATNQNRIIIDTDGDGIVDWLDLDSDNDGILDNREAQSTADFRAPLGIDSDGDGLDNAYDINGGSFISMSRWDGARYDYRNTNTDNDRFADWIEGFDDNRNGQSLDDIKARATAWSNLNPARSSYYPLAGVPVSQGPTWMFDADNDGVPNFLDPQSSFYRDDNKNGLVDLYDPAFGGVPSTTPKRTNNQIDADFRFQGQQTPLPVELISFQAKSSGRDALVTWATASEKDNARFLVERSADASTFVVAGTVEGKGTTSRRSDYSFTDKNVGTSAGTRYYRLRQVDQDGKESVSEVRVVGFDGKGAVVAISAYPSPATDNATLDLLALPTATYSVEIMAADGRVMTRFEAQGGREVALPVAGYAKGTYLVRVSGQGQNYLVKLLKN